MQGVLDDRDCQKACPRSHGTPAGGAGVSVVLDLLPLFQTRGTDEMTSRAARDRSLPWQRSAYRAFHNFLLFLVQLFILGSQFCQLSLKFVTYVILITSFSVSRSRSIVACRVFHDEVSSSALKS